MTTDYSTDLSMLLPEMRGPAGVKPQETTFNLRRLFRLRTPLMLAVFAVLAVPSVIAVYLLTPLEYQAEAMLSFSARQVPLFSGQETRITSANYDKYLNTQVNYLTSNDLLSRLLNDEKIRDLKMLSGIVDKVGYLRSIIEVRPIRNSEDVVIRCRAKDRAEALIVVTILVNEYMREATGEVRTSGNERLTSLTRIRDTTQTELDKQQARLSELYHEAGTVVGNPVTDTGAQEMQSYHENLTKAKADRSTAESVVGRLETILTEVRQVEETFKKNPDRPLSSFNVELRVSQDPVVVGLRGELAKTEQNRNMMSERYQNDAPQLKALNEARDSVKQQLGKEEQRARGEAIRALLEQNQQDLLVAQQALKDAKNRETEFQEYISKNKQEMLENSRKLNEVEDLKRSIEDQKARLKATQDEIYSIDVESNAPASIKVKAQAYAPPEPDSGNLLQFVLLALFGSMLVGAGVGVVRELLDEKIRTDQDVSAVTNLPVLASISNMAERTGAPLLAVDYPNSAIADEYRRILTRIVYPPEGSAELNTCLITSAAARDGRTSVACNIAIALAQANRRVLLLDINAQSPRVEEVFDMAPGEGLSEVLCEGMDPAALVRPSSFTNLWVLGPGFLTDELTGKLPSRETVEFLERAEQTYEHVIIDTPASLLTSDAKLLAPVVDGVLVVAGVDSSTLGTLRRCLQELHLVGANIVGITVNGVRSSHGEGARSASGVPSGFSSAGAARRSTASVRPAAPDDDEDAPTIMLVDDDEPKN